MKLKYVLVTTIVAMAVLCSVSTVSATDTADLPAMINSLRQQIAELQEKLKALLLQQQEQQGTWCHTFNANIGVGVKTGNAEIEALKTALQKEGLYDAVASTTNGYDEALASAVTGFQEKYASQILTPSNLKHGTGYVGVATRKKLNVLYGCAPIACTMEAKQCPDGSYVGRTGPDCEFAPCPKTECAADSDCPTIYCIKAPCPQNVCVKGKCIAKEADCNYLWWLDNTDKSCSAQKKFCGAFMYYGLQTFATQPECLAVSGNNGGISINGISGPTTLKAGQAGVWTIKANSTKGGVLSYSAIWADETSYSPTAIGNMADKVQQAVFTHSYSQPGAYSPIFYVKDEFGNSAKSSISVNVVSSSQCVTDLDCPSICPTCAVDIYGNHPSCGGCTIRHCVEGKCVEAPYLVINKPTCGAIGSRSESWSDKAGFIKYDNCATCDAKCSAQNTDLEGWYSSCDGKLIKYGKCAN